MRRSRSEDKEMRQAGRADTGMARKWVGRRVDRGEENNKGRRMLSYASIRKPCDAGDGGG